MVKTIGLESAAKLALGVGIALGASAAMAADGIWKYQEGVGTGGTDWTSWSETGNWKEGAVAGEGGKADLTTAKNRYISANGAISLTGLRGSPDGKTVVRSDSTLTLTLPNEVDQEVGNLWLYAPLTTDAKSYNYGSPNGLMLCGPHTRASGSSAPFLSGQNEFRLDCYATAAGEKRSNAAWSAPYRANAWSTLCFVAPYGSSSDIVANWSQTEGSPFLRRAAGQDEHVLSVGTTVTGAGIPAGTFLKRVFPDGTIELSAAAQTTSAANALTFAAFRSQVTVPEQWYFAWLGGTGTHYLNVEKYREEDDFTVEIFQIHQTGAALQNDIFEFSTRDGFVPGTIQISGQNDYALYRLNDCHLLLTGNLDLKHIVSLNAGKTARLTVKAGNAYGFKSLDELVGTIVKDGAGTLAFAFPSDAKTKLTGNLVVEEGVLAPTAVAGAVNYVANLTIKSGAEFVMPEGGFACDTLTVEEGAIISGSGPMSVGNLTPELAKKAILRGGAYFVDTEPEEGPLSFEVINGSARQAAQDGEPVLVFSSNALVRVHGTGSLAMLLVGGGGGGGSKLGGGGGGGGVIYTNLTVKSGIYAVNVGLGGKGAPDKSTLNTSGGDSSFFGLTAFGGGAGGTFVDAKRDGTYANRGVAGGSGGGGGTEYHYSSTSTLPGGTGVAGQGHDGGQGLNVAYPGSYANSPHYCCGGGGGGAGTPGQAATVTRDANNKPVSVSGACGGDGVLCTILGSQYYGGGGGGGGCDKAVATACKGGLGGGGNGTRSYSASDAGKKGTDGLGGGGGGGSGYTTDGGGGAGGDGGNGIVIFRWQNTVRPQPADDLLATGGTVRRRGGYAIHTFAADGTFALSEDAFVDILLVGGGGGGGSRTGGGGGAGGVVVLSNAFLKAGSHAVVVGAGGAGAVGAGAIPKNGSDTTLAIGEGLNIVAFGGGGAGQDGGSPGGGDAPYVLSSTLTNQPGVCSIGQGHAGGVGVHHYTGSAIADRYSAMAGGGGGAGTPGGDGNADAQTPGDGGDGVWNGFSGKDVCYGGGGGGGSAVYLYGKSFIAKGGEGGGGGGGGLYNDYPNSSRGLDGVDGLGGGGGGGGGVVDGFGDGGNGGDGIAIIRYAVKPCGMSVIIR